MDRLRETCVRNNGALRHETDRQVARLNTYPIVPVRYRRDVGLDVWARRIGCRRNGVRVEQGRNGRESC